MEASDIVARTQSISTTLTCSLSKVRMIPSGNEFREREEREREREKKRTKNSVNRVIERLVSVEKVYEPSIFRFSVVSALNLTFITSSRCTRLCTYERDFIRTF